MPRPVAVFLLPALAAMLSGCAQPVDPANPRLWPFNILATASADPAEQQRRGAVELAVKAGFPAILADIEAGGGARLTAAFDAARVPPQDRAARTLQLQGDLPIYADTPGALVTALLIYGG
ncbi:MAG: hypothetical protein JJT81_09510 [Rubellimicrobium sp.]|nr:hypothetical protein [Rubellimicrobium sp.]